ncbi:sialidase, partial [Vibrio anguillarum]|nr:sialidase [Vibrio anguillarum]
MSIKMTSQQRSVSIHKETDSNIKGVDMRFKNVKKTALMLAMFGMATSSNAALFDYNATGDTEFDSPAKQGWMQDNTNNGSGVLIN